MNSQANYIQPFKRVLLEVDPFVSFGNYIKNSDPMVSTGVQKKNKRYIFYNTKKRRCCKDIINS